MEQFNLDRCPYCGKKIIIGAKQCPFCGEDLSDLQPPEGYFERHQAASSTSSAHNASSASNASSDSSTYSQAGTVPPPPPPPGPQQSNSSGYSQNQQQYQNQQEQQYHNQQQYQQQPPYGQQQFGNNPYGYQVPPNVPKMLFTDAVKTCLIEKYATFSGRARRSEFWWWYLAQTLITYIMSRVVSFTSDVPVSSFASSSGELFGIIWDSMGSVLKNPVWWLSMVVCLALFIPNIAAISRRFHDIGKSGWWQILPYALLLLNYLLLFLKLKVFLLYPLFAFLCLGAFIIMIVWLCTDSDPKPNKWGPSPKYGNIKQ